MDVSNQNTVSNDQTDIEIAARSSIDVLPTGPFRKTYEYPLPRDLEIALKVVEKHPELTESAEAYLTILKFLKKFTVIKPHQYWFIMKLLLYLDYHQNELDMEEYTLHNQKITPSMYTSNSFVIHVPGLSEDRPSVRTKDTVMINQSDGKNFCASTVTSVGANYITAYVQPEFKEAFQSDQRYDISFEYSDHCFRCSHHAVDRAVQFNLLSVLFPLKHPVQKIQKQEELVWINENMKSNPEQQQAVINIMARTAFPAPYVLFGPPGTGKTSTLVETICQILKKNSSNRILVCTPSNAAADEVALRLLKNSIETHDIHRMYSMSRESKDIPEALKECSNLSGDRTAFVSKDILLSKKIVIATLITCHRLVHYSLRENHFAYVFVDEAGQATEPETLIPMTLMSSNDDSHKGRLHGQIVIAGDPQQLGPSIRSKIAEHLLGCSMLERLMNWKLYRKNRNNKFNPSYVTKLVRNYRCHPAILHVPNQLFYEGELMAIGGAHTERALNWRTLPKPNFPVIFHAVDGKEGREPRSPSVFNAQEIRVVMSYVEDLLRSKLGGKAVRQEDIGIVTPYKLQRQKIHELLDKKNWNEVSVGTVETFQGQEKDIIIISTVRSVLYQHNHQLHIGFLSNPKRFNVAITRAKSLLIVVGNPAVLQYDKNWFSFLKYCVDLGAVLGSKFSLDRSMQWSRIRTLLGKKHVPTLEVNNDMPFKVVEEAPVEPKSFTLPQKNSERRRRLPKREPACDEFSGRNIISTNYSELSRLHKYLFDVNNSRINGAGVNDDDDDEDMEEYEIAKGIFSDDNESESSELIFDSNENTNDSDNSMTSSSEMINQSSKSPSPNDASVSEISICFPNLAISAENTESL